MWENPDVSRSSKRERRYGGLSDLGILDGSCMHGSGMVTCAMLGAIFILIDGTPDQTSRPPCAHYSY